jgi:hypothetical protein
MTEKNIFLIITICGSLLSVAMGALLSPFVASRIEKRKQKNNLKPELMKEVSLLFSLRKSLFLSLNYERFHSVKAHILWTQLRKTNLTGEARQEIERQYNVHKEDIDDLSAKGNEYYDKVNASEAQITYLLAQVEIYFGKKTYNSIYYILYPYLSNFVTKLLYDYSKQMKDGVELDGDDFTNQVNFYNVEMEKLRREVQKSLSSLF